MIKSLSRTLAIILAFIAGYLMPELHVYSWLFKWLLIIMLFITFLGIQYHRLKPTWTHCWMVLANIVIGFLAWGGSYLFLGAGDVAESAFFTGIMPTATASPVIMGLLGGSVEFVLTALLLCNGVICALLPMVLPAVIGQEGWGIYASVAGNIVQVMLLPLILSIIVRHYYPKAIHVTKKLKNFSFGMWVVILVLIAANASHDIASRADLSAEILWVLGGLSLIICAINFRIGYLIGGNRYGAECSQSLGQKNTTLAIYLALTYSGPIAALGPTFYVLWHNLWNAWQLFRASERERLLRTEKD